MRLSVLVNASSLFGAWRGVFCYWYRVRRCRAVAGRSAVASVRVPHPPGATKLPLVRFGRGNRDLNRVEMRIGALGAQRPVHCPLIERGQQACNSVSACGISCPPGPDRCWQTFLRGGQWSRKRCGIGARRRIDSRWRVYASFRGIAWPEGVHIAGGLRVVLRGAPVIGLTAQVEVLTLPLRQAVDAR